MTYENPSIPDRLIKFFIKNPDEELTLSDITVKYDCSRATAENALTVVRTKIALEKVTTYRLKVSP